MKFFLRIVLSMALYEITLAKPPKLTPPKFVCDYFQLTAEKEILCYNEEVRQKEECEKINCNVKERLNDPIARDEEIIKRRHKVDTPLPKCETVERLLNGEVTTRPAQRDYYKKLKMCK